MIVTQAILTDGAMSKNLWIKQSCKTSQSFCSSFSHFADIPPANEVGEALKIHKSFMVRNGLFTLPAHTSASTEQAGPAADQAWKPPRAYGALQTLKASPGRAVVAPMNYRNDLIVFSFGNSGGSPLGVSFLTACGFQRGDMIQCCLPLTRLYNPRWSVLSKQSQSWGVSQTWSSKLVRKGEG